MLCNLKLVCKPFDPTINSTENSKFHISSIATTLKREDYSSDVISEQLWKKFNYVRKLL